MEFERFLKDMQIISALDDEPNDVGGLTAAELKAKFDEGGAALKEFLNDVLLPALEENAAGKEELKTLVTDEELAEVLKTLVTDEELAGVLKTLVTDEELAEVLKTLVTDEELAEVLDKALKEIVLGNVPDGSITMEKLSEDVKEKLDAPVTEEDLAEDVKEKLDNAVQADDVYGKAETLSDKNRSVFGLSSLGTPDDVFSFLGKYNQHWWQRTGNLFVETLDAVEKNVQITIIYPTAQPNYPIFYCSESYTVSEDGATYTLVSPQVVQPPINGYESKLDVLKGKYWHIGSAAATASSPLYYTPADADSFVTEMQSYSQSMQDWPYALKGTRQKVTVTRQYTTDYVYSTDRSAHPDSGTDAEGVFWVYLGIPFETLPMAADIVYGEYVGTGAYGQTSPNTLTFSKPVYALFIDNRFQATRGTTQTVTNNYNSTATVSWETNAVSWYSTSYDRQLNTAGTTYSYIAILMGGTA